MKKFGLSILIAFISYVGIGHLLKEDISIKVNKSERVNEQYLIYTDKGTFKCVDDFRFLKFNSSDMYAKFAPNQTYDIQATGFRIPFFSVYKNITSVK